MSELPLMTNHGTFIINGVERVIVPQLARSFEFSLLNQKVRVLDILEQKLFQLVEFG